MSSDIFHALLIIVGVIVQVFIPGFPKELLLLQSGIVFGVIFGSIINWIAMILAAQIGYEVVRRSVEGGGKFSSFLENYQNWSFITRIEEKGNYGLFLLRLIPTAPNDILSLISGSLFLPRRGYFMVSVITAIPYAVLLAYIGSKGSEFIDPIQVLQLNILLFFACLIGWIIMYYWRRKRTFSS